MNRQLKLLFLIPLATLSLAISNTPPSNAASGEPLIGTWEGAVFVDDSPIGVDLEITQVKTNTNDGVFHYGEPRACRLTLSYITTSNGLYWFAMKESTGGYCDKLNGKKITFRLDASETSMAYEIAGSQTGGETETATLQKNE